MSISNILTELGLVRQNIKLKKIFADIVYNVSVVKGFWWNIEKYDYK